MSRIDERIEYYEEDNDDYLAEIRRVLGLDTGKSETVFFEEEEEELEQPNVDVVDTAILNDMLVHAKINHPVYEAQLIEKPGMLYAEKLDGVHVVLIMYGRNFYKKGQDNVELVERGRGRPLPYQCLIEAEQIENKYYCLDLIWDSGKMHLLPIRERVEWIRTFIEDANVSPNIQLQKYYDTIAEVPKGEGVVYVDIQAPYGHSQVFRYKYNETLDCALMPGEQGCVLGVARGDHLYMLPGHLDVVFGDTYVGQIVEVSKRGDNWHVERMRTDKTKPNSYDMYCRLFPIQVSQYQQVAIKKTDLEVQQEFRLFFLEGVKQLGEQGFREEYLKQFFVGKSKNDLIMFMQNRQKLEEHYQSWAFRSGASEVQVRPVVANVPTIEYVEKLKTGLGQPDPRSMVLKPDKPEFIPGQGESHPGGPNRRGGRQGPGRGRKGGRHRK